MAAWFERLISIQTIKRILHVIAIELWFTWGCARTRWAWGAPVTASRGPTSVWRPAIIGAEPVGSTQSPTSPWPVITWAIVAKVIVVRSLTTKSEIKTKPFSWQMHKTVIITQTFKFVGEILKCDHSNESFWAVLSYGADYLYKLVLNFDYICGWNP